jgi:hypothetical protein
LVDNAKSESVTQLEVTTRLFILFEYFKHNSVEDENVKLM